MTREMSLPSTSIESSAHLVLDASVAINLLATGIAGRLCELLACPISMETRAYREVRRHPIPGRDHSAELGKLIEAGTLVVRELSQTGLEIFYELASADIPGGLDDGEAATIALALTLPSQSIAVLDERKAKKLLSARWPAQVSFYTIDLLSDIRITSAMAAKDSADAIFDALTHARMRVPPEARQWVISVIGTERAARCPSLGRLQQTRA